MSWDTLVVRAVNLNEGELKHDFVFEAQWYFPWNSFNREKKFAFFSFYTYNHSYTRAYMRAAHNAKNLFRQVHNSTPNTLDGTNWICDNKSLEVSIWLIDSWESLCETSNNKHFECIESEMKWNTLLFSCSKGEKKNAEREKFVISSIWSKTWLASHRQIYLPKTIKAGG